MIMRHGVHGIVGPLSAVVVLSFPALAGAQGGFIHRHHRLAGMAAGIGAYKMAKHTGSHRLASGRHRNFAQRHPFLTGAAAGMATNHVAKHHHHL